LGSLDGDGDGVSVGAAVMTWDVKTISGGTVVGDGSWQPQNLPGCSHVVDKEVVGVVGLVVVISVVVVMVVLVVLSLQPNQPGVLQVLVELVVVVDSPVVVVVVSSRQPHQPGVLQVAVRVRVFVEVDDFDVVVVSVPLLSYIFHFAQSLHSGVNLHSAMSSYFMITS
jgi:hypothetical protein